MTEKSSARLGRTQAKQQSRWSLRQKLIIGGLLCLAVVALAVGLGVGLTRGQEDGDSDDSSTAPSTTPSPSSPNATVWKPSGGVTWQLQLLNPPTSTSTDGLDVWDIDLFDTAASTIAGLQANGAKVICYFSAGSYEDWRPDASDFDKADMGKELDGWPGERWLQISSSRIHEIMLARLDIAAAKNCDGVDPDNVDGYNNDNGLDLTTEDSVQYIKFLSDASHQRNMSMGLKNANDIIPNVIDLVEYSVNEQCEEYDECNTYKPFIQQGKPVFHVEYPKGDSTNNNNLVASDTRNSICDNASAAGFSTIIKNMNLDAWRESCPATQ